MMNFKRNRDVSVRNTKSVESGQMLAVSAVACLLITLLGVAFFQICLVIGGAKEFRNSVDAGTLAIARYALGAPAVPISSASPFARIASDTTAAGAGMNGTAGSIIIQNVNMVIGEAWLVRANEYDMEQQGTSTGFASNGSAQNAFQFNMQASGVVSQLLGELSNELNDTYPDFNSKFDLVSRANPLRMFFGGSPVNADTPWKVAYLKPKQASNIWITSNQTTSELPQSLSPKAFPPTIRKTINGTDYTYMQGYVPDTLNTQYDLGPPLPFITLEPTIRPYLFDTGEFNSALTPPSGLDPRSISYLVPNGFSTTAAVKVPISGQTLQFVSCGALAEMDCGFPCLIPDGIISIKNNSSLPFQVAECVSNQSVFQLISQRALEITPDSTTEHLVAQLSGTIPPGHSQYIFAAPASNPAAPPTSQQKAAQPDGQPMGSFVLANGKQQMKCIPSTGANKCLLVVKVTDYP
jgi:hypothetical protein